MPFKQVILASPMVFNYLQSVAFGGVRVLRVNAELEVILLCLPNSKEDSRLKEYIFPTFWGL